MSAFADLMRPPKPKPRRRQRWRSCGRLEYDGTVYLLFRSPDAPSVWAMPLSQLMKKGTQHDDHHADD